MQRFPNPTLVSIPSNLAHLFPDCISLAEAWRKSQDGVHMLMLASAIAQDEPQRREVRSAAIRVAAAIDSLIGKRPNVSPDAPTEAYHHTQSAAYDAAGVDGYASRDKTMPDEYADRDEDRHAYIKASKEARLCAAEVLRARDTHLLWLMRFETDDDMPTG